MKIKPVCRNSIGIKSCSLSLLSLSVRTFPSWLLLLKHLSSGLLVQTGTEVTGARCAGRGEGLLPLTSASPGSWRSAVIPGQYREQLLAGWAPGAGPYGAHRTLQTLLCLHIRFYLATPARAELTRFGAVCRLQAGRPRLAAGLGVNWGELG
jgi:hypothetical protein